MSLFIRNDENIKIKVDKMFKLFQETKRDGGWSSFLGFKEVRSIENIFMHVLLKSEINNYF